MAAKLSTELDIFPLMNCSEFFKISLSFNKKNGFIFFSKPILEGRVISELDLNLSTFFEYFIRSRFKYA